MVNKHKTIAQTYNEGSHFDSMKKSIKFALIYDNIKHHTTTTSF